VQNIINVLKIKTNGIIHAELKSEDAGCKTKKTVKNERRCQSLLIERSQP